MSDKEHKKIWKTAQVSTYTHYDEFESLEDAERSARADAWNTGKDYWILGPVGKAKAPVEVNTVQVEKIS